MTIVMPAWAVGRRNSHVIKNYLSVVARYNKYGIGSVFRILVLSIDWMKNKEEEKKSHQMADLDPNPVLAESSRTLWSVL